MGLNYQVKWIRSECHPAERLPVVRDRQIRVTSQVSFEFHLIRETDTYKIHVEEH